MKKLNKPQKYSEVNVEFYSAEGIPPVQSTPTTNNSTYGQNSGYNAYGSTNSNSSNSNNRNNSNNSNNGSGSIFADIFTALLGIDD